MALDPACQGAVDAGEAGGEIKKLTDRGRVVRWKMFLTLVKMGLNEIINNS